MGYRIGFDIGSTTIKAVVLDENNQICYKSYERHKAQVRQKALDKLVELKKYTLLILWKGMQGKTDGAEGLL